MGNKKRNTKFKKSQIKPNELMIILINTCLKKMSTKRDVTDEIQS